MLPLFSLHLLDVLELWEAGSDALTRLPIGKGAELLALLAYRSVEVPRGEAAGLLWPDAPDATARHRLRTLLLELGHRHVGLLRIARDRVGLGSEVQVPLDRPGVFAPGIEGEWLEEARADLAYRQASRLIVEAQERAAEEPMAAIGLAEHALRLVPESLAAEALLARLRSRPLVSEMQAAPFLSLRDRARVAIARAPVAQASGHLRLPSREADELLTALPPDPPLRAALMVARAGYAYEAGEYPACRRFAEGAIATDRNKVWAGPADEAWARLWIARVGYSSGDYIASVASARQSSRVAQECGETNLVVLAECLIAISELLHGRLERIETHLARAREAAAGEPYLLSRCDNVAGWHALGAGAWVRAIPLFERARAGSAPDLRLTSNALQGLARAHEMAGDHGTARARLEEAIGLLEGTDLDLVLVGVLAALADLEEAEGQYASALDLHRQGLARRAGAGDRLGLYTSLAGIGRLSLKLGRGSEAIRHLREAYALHTALLGEVRLPIAALPLAEALLDSGRTREAVGLVARSIEVLENESPEIRAGSTYPAEIPALAERLQTRLSG